MDVTTSWNAALKIIEQEISSPISYETWILPIVPIGINGNRFLLRVGESFYKEMLEKRHLPLIRNALKAVTNMDYEIVILTEGEPAPVLEQLREPLQKHTDMMGNNLNPKYVFSSFVVGNSNRMAHAASLAVAEAPAQAYNPLFLYGNSGLGKTHLMHSIAHFILNKNPQTKVLYVTSETFTNELILSIQNNKNEEFRNKYRGIDVLLIDDIQFISKKEGTQEEFFHTFNALYESSKQIIISSDRPPKEIKTLEDRLRSRFESGLIADIQPPDYETRIAILRKKADSDHLEIGDELLSYIAKNIASNIRELEGALTRIAAYAKLTNQKISLELTEKCIKDVYSENTPVPLSPSVIQEAVARHYNITADDIRGNKKPKSIAFPRQVSMYLCRKLLDLSLPKIGESFGGRDHTTIIHGISKIEKQMETDEGLKETIIQLEKELREQ